MKPRLHQASGESGESPASGQRVRRPRGRFRDDRLYVGWQCLLAEPDPGPAPLLPALTEPDTVSRAWISAQRREHRRLSRPPRLAAVTGLATVAAVTSASLTGLTAGWPVLVIAAAGTWLTAASCLRLVRAEQAHQRDLRAEADRIARFRDVQLADRAADEREHAERYHDWQQRAAVFRRQPRWYPVTLPTTAHRIDVAGGTLAGWSALLTMLAVPRLAAGGDVTVLDLTEGGVAADLLAVGRRSGLDPQVWVLPGDLPKLDLGATYDADVLADVLARTVSAADWMAQAAPPPSAPADPARDAAVLSRILDVLGPGGPPVMVRLLAALRALGQIGGPAEHLGSAELTPQELAGLALLAGRGAERLVIDRAWVMEARLRALAPLAARPLSLPPSRLAVAWLDRRAATTGNEVLAAYLAVALTAALRHAPPGRRWRQTVSVLGAERLPGNVLDRLCDAAEVAGTGLLLGYRAVPAQVRERLGRGDAAVGFMRLGNADDARAAAEQIGTEYRFVVSQFTDTVGASVTDTAGVSYTGSAGTSESAADSGSVSLTSGRSRGTGRSGPAFPGSVRRRDRVGQPGCEFLGRHLGLALDHRGHQHRNLVGLDHVPRSRNE